MTVIVDKETLVKKCRCLAKTIKPIKAGDKVILTLVVEEDKYTISLAPGGPIIEEGIL